MSYQAGIEDAIRNAGRFLQEAGATAVKLEGGAHVAETIARLVTIGIPTMGHLGLTPQSVNQFGGHKVQAKTPAAAVKLINDAIALQEAGAFAVVLEGIPSPLARIVSERLDIPTIGIGAGPTATARQVFHDFGAIPTSPKHAKQFAHLADEIRNAVLHYIEEVQSGTFPTAKESFTMDAAVLAELSRMAV
jgi:3-methyl-2-oxobutanoate hydroxymethyltransferase